MTELRITHVGRYVQAQRTAYVAPAHYVGFSLSGLVSYRRNGLPLPEIGAHLLLTPAGSRLEFEYDARRENWVVQFEGDQLRAVPGGLDVEWRLGAEWVRLPSWLPVPAARTSAWRQEFTRLWEAFREQTPQSRLRAVTGVMGVLREFLERLPAEVDQSPAARFKRLLSEDCAGRESVAALGRRCGYSPDHLRRQFIARYGLTPLAYRNRQRLTLAMDLAAGSRLSVKEIARAAGFSYVSHLSNQFRRAFGLSPREAIRQFRPGGF